MIFVIPDTHLGHENIKKYCNRPDNFEALIEKNWNAAVSDSDTVIHLGDVSFKDFLVKKLAGWRQPRQPSAGFLHELRLYRRRRGAHD